MHIHFFAHAGEVHSSEVTSAIHELAWYVQLPLFVLVAAMVAATIWLISKKVDTTLLITSALLLISGFALYELAPLVSALAITTGLVATLGVTLLGLGGENKK